MQPIIDLILHDLKNINRTRTCKTYTVKQLKLILYETSENMAKLTFDTAILTC